MVYTIAKTEDADQTQGLGVLNHEELQCVAHRFLKGSLEFLQGSTPQVWDLKESHCVHRSQQGSAQVHIFRLGTSQLTFQCPNANDQAQTASQRT